MFASFPEHIAGYHVFHRLSMPRHPPYTLSSLITFIDHRRIQLLLPRYCHTQTTRDSSSSQTVTSSVAFQRASWTVSERLNPKINWISSGRPINNVNYSPKRCSTIPARSISNRRKDKEGGLVLPGGWGAPTNTTWNWEPVSRRTFSRLSPPRGLTHCWNYPPADLSHKALHSDQNDLILNL